MKKPWFKSVAFWTGLVASVALAGPFGGVAAIAWCAGFAIYRLTGKNKQSNIHDQRQIQPNVQHSSARKDQDGIREQQPQKQGPYNPYHAQGESIAPKTPVFISPKGSKGRNTGR